MESTDPKILNPWVAMWTQPRATIQQIVDTNPKRFVLPLAALVGFSRYLDSCSYKNTGEVLEWPRIILLAGAIGPILGLLALYIGGWLLRWTGKWVGGNASLQNIRAAIAWSGVPILWALLLWIPALLLFGQELFTKETPILSASSSLSSTFLVYGLIDIVIAIWAFVVFLKCLGQVQGFSAWKALLNGFLALFSCITLIAIPVFIALQVSYYLVSIL